MPRTTRAVDADLRDVIIRELFVPAKAMNLESLREFCLSLPGATADIKWGQDLVFSVGKKMFCAVNTERHTSVRSRPRMMISQS